MPRLTSVRKEWFDYPNDPDGARLEIKHLKPGEIQEIEARVNKMVGSLSEDTNADGIPEIKTKIDIQPYLRKKEIVKAAVVDWENFFGLDGSPAKCTEKNKLLFLKELDDFYEVVEQMRDALAGKVAEEMEGADPN